MRRVPAVEKSLIIEADKSISQRKLCLMLGVTDRYIRKVKTELEADKKQGELF